MDRRPSDRVDVCVVGAGPAGALAAHRLAERGHEVVVLEAGPRFEFESRLDRMERAIRPAHSDNSVWNMGGERDAYSSSGELFYPLNAARVKGIGGSTLHWQGMVMRHHEADFERRTRDGVAADWPIGYDDLKPYYATAETELGVAGASDNPFAPPRDDPHPLPAFEPSYSDSLFAEACERLGVVMHSVPNARNSEGYDDRSACVGYGTCKPVCPSGAKYSADVHVRKAEDAGARVIDRAPVQELVTDDAGRVEAARYATPDGETHRQTAREFVLACGGVEIPRLLLMSRSTDHPDGLANSSGLVGRYFTEHLFCGAGGLLDERTRQNHVGFITSECHQFYDEPGRATEGSDGGIPGSDADLGPMKLEFLNYAGPSPVELALSADEFGDDLLSSLRDAYGNTWSLDSRTKRTIRRANEIQHTILEELGVDIGWTVGPENTGPAFHHMGTTRMGTDPAESVVNPQLRTHDVPNLSVASSSVFVTPGALNPTLTIAALSLKCADHVDERL
jgi:choline dehydrogenase-like flavoprotein